ncbi:hypothetical protein AYO38_00185 [bacterium SCGC AG-212-C10]|nr:hypothetical protein AYO38_00185 [bacterium SCGC AG-212-C10]
MATVIIPAPLRVFSNGESKAEVPGATLGALLRALDDRYPGIYDRVVAEGRVRPELAIAIDGEAASYSLHEPLRPNADITIIPAIGGG